MRPPPHARLTLLAPLLTCAFFNPPATRSAEVDAAQSVRGDAKQSAPKKADGRAAAQAARIRRETRAAVAAVKEAAELARSFEDVYESVRAQAEAADAVWLFDEQWARFVLRRAWDATNAPGAEDRVQGFGTSENPREAAQNALEAARRLVIKAALKHDARMADAFITEFESFLAEHTPAAGERGREDTSPTSPAPADAAPVRRRRTLSPAGWQRLSVARQLFDEGDFVHAASAAAPLAAAGPTPQLIDFILLLRTRDAQAADGLYLRLLGATRADLSADVNDVLTLSTAVVTPGVYVFVGEDGSPGFDGRPMSEEERRAPLPDELRAAFYVVAAGVLLRPGAPGGGRAEAATALYFAINRLLPFFESEAPQHAPALQARRTALASEMAAGRRANVEATARVGSLSVVNPADPLEYVLADIASAGNTSARDAARLRAVATAARRALWERAHGIADRIEDAETRRDARLVIAVRQVTSTASAFDDGDAEDIARAADIVRVADVPTEVRALGLAQAAELAARLVNRARAGQLLAEAAGYAGQAERGERRVTALALVTLSAARVGDARVWELLPALTAAVDETDDLPFGALNLEFMVGRENGRLSFFALDAPIGLPEVFAAAARLDALKTFTEARGFKDEEMRAASLLAAGRAALEKSGRAPRPAGVR